MASIIQGAKDTIAENFGGASHSLAKPEHQFSLEEVPDQSGKVAVITGGSRGIGFGCTQTLLSKNISKIFLISRTEKDLTAAKSDVTSALGASYADKITWLPCDLSDWKKVVSTAEEIKKQTDRVDILIEDAARGIMTYQVTDYGVDRHMAVNHFGHVILTSHLLPVLKKTAEQGHVVRIVTLGSNAHQGTPSDCKFENLDELNQDLGPNGQYGRSKLAVMLYAKYLNKHLTTKYPKILANSVHPGFVETKQSVEEIHEAFPVAGYAMSVGVNPLKKDQFMGAVSAMFCATKTDRSGEYICPPAIPEAGNKLVQDEALMERLMVLTETVVKEKMGADLGKCPLAFY